MSRGRETRCIFFLQSFPPRKSTALTKVVDGSVPGRCYGTGLRLGCSGKQGKGAFEPQRAPLCPFFRPSGDRRVADRAIGGDD